MRIAIKDIPERIKPGYPISYKKIKVKSTAYNPDGKPISMKFAQELAFRMIKTCLTDDGIGLAAPQLGIFRQLVAIRDLQDDTQGNVPLDTFSCYFNPSWLGLPSPEGKDHDKETDFEGCLSVPGEVYDVPRWKTIKATWLELVEDGVFLERTEVMTGLKARIFQHEYDHLNCKSIIDRGTRMVTTVPPQEEKAP